MTSAGVEVRRSAAQRKTMVTLVGSQAIGGVGVTTGMSVGALLAEDILGSADLAGLAQTTQVFGTAGAAYVIARLTMVTGRRRGFVLAYAIGGLGSILCVIAGVVESFPLLLVGTTLVGAASAANSQARYAATDLADPARRATALSIVMWATTIGAVLGPNLVGWTGDRAVDLGLPRLTGGFLASAIGTAVAAAYLMWRLRPDPLLLARELAAEESGLAPARRRRAVEVIRTYPASIAGIVAIAAGHMVMVAVMAMTPLHMDHGGASLELIGLVLSLHILGMFAFSPLVGWLSDVVGARTVLLAGVALLLVAVALAGSAPEGSSPGLTAGLFLLGLGWSCTMVAGSAIVTNAVPLDERPSVQGLSDLVMGLGAGTASAIAGVVVGQLGFSWLNAGAAVIVTLIVGAAFAVPPRKRPEILR